MKPDLLALAVALAALPACSKNLTVGSPGMPRTCVPPKLEVVTEPGDPGDGDFAFVFSSGPQSQYPARIVLVNTRTRCVTRVLDVPPQTIPDWQVKMGDRITGVFSGPRPPPPPPDGEPKIMQLDDVVRAMDQLKGLQM